MTIPIDYGFDAMIHTEMALKYSDSWNFFSADFYDQSPPLRYVPYTLLITIIQPDTYNVAFRLCTLYASMMTFVGGSIAAYELGRVNISEDNQVLAIIAISLFILVSFVWPGNRFFAGKWQYTTTFPLLIISLIIGSKSVTSEEDMRRWWAVGTGVVLGLLGLQQLTNAAIASMAIGLGYVFYRRWFVLLTTGLIGAGFGSLLFVGQSEAQSRALNSIFINFLPESGRLTLDISKFTTPGVILVTFGLIITGWLMLIRPNHKPITVIIDCTVVILSVMWASSAYTTASDYLAATTIFPLIFFATFASSRRVIIVLQEWLNLYIYPHK